MTSTTASWTGRFLSAVPAAATDRSAGIGTSKAHRISLHAQMHDRHSQGQATEGRGVRLPTDSTKKAKIRRLLHEVHNPSMQETRSALLPAAALLRHTVGHRPCGLWTRHDRLSILVLSDLRLQRHLEGHPAPEPMDRGERQGRLLSPNRQGHAYGSSYSTVDDST